MLEKTKKLNVPAQKQVKQVKIALVGDSQSGKSAFMSKYIEDKFPNSYSPTLGVQTGNKFIEAKNGAVVHVTLWDFSGQDKFFDLRIEFYRQADVVFVFCDLSDSKSIKGSLEEVKSHGAETVFVVGSKKDSKKSKEGQKAAKDEQKPYYQISAKTGQGIEELMNKAIETVGK